MDIEESKGKLTRIADEMKAMNELCITEDRDFSEEEDTKYADLEKELNSIKKEVESEEKAAQDRAERAAKLKERQSKLAAASAIEFPGNPRIESIEAEDFKSLNDFLSAAVRKIFYPAYQDNRLTRWYSVTTNDPRFEQRAEQSMGEGTAGGYMVPTQHLPEIKSLAVQNAIIRPRADVIPPGDPPDAEITLPVEDQSANVNAGVVVTWTKEGATKGQTDFGLKEFSLIPHEVSGYINVTDKLLRNWPACITYVENKFKKAVMIAEDTAFLSGNGVGKPKGITTQNCRIIVTRNTANSIQYADIRKMIWQLLAENGDNIVWVISPSAVESLLALADPGSAGTMIFQPNAREGMPFTLMGYPIFKNQRSPGVGTAGDLMLLNLNYYVIKDGSGPYIAASPHVHFTSNKTCIKVFWNVDGDSWLQDKFPLEGDSGNYLSPFVILE